MSYPQTNDVAWDNCQRFCICTTCGLIGIEFEGRSDRLSCKECYACADARRGLDVSGYLVVCPGKDICAKRCHRGGGNNDRGHTPDHPRIQKAIVAARSARFEHGESPRF